MMSRRKKNTDQLEMVETYNIYLSLKRLREGHNEERMKRALYHAILMSGALDFQMKKQIRETLNLP